MSASHSVRSPHQNLCTRFGQSSSPLPGPTLELHVQDAEYPRYQMTGSASQARTDHHHERLLSVLLHPYWVWPSAGDANADPPEGGAAALLAALRSVFQFLLWAVRTILRLRA